MSRVEKSLKNGKGNRTRTQADESDVQNEKPTSMRVVTRAISSKKVNTQWPKISEYGQLQIIKLLQLSAPPIIQSAVSGESKRSELQQYLTTINSKISRKLSKIPVPPSTMDIHYSYDNIMEQQNQLEGSLIPMLEQVQFLEQEIRNEERKLAADEIYLKNMQKAKSQQSNRQSIKNVSELLSKYNQNSEIADSIDDIDYDDDDSANGNSLQSLPDPKLDSLMIDFSNQIKRLQKNNKNLIELLNISEDIQDQIGPSNDVV